MRDSLNILLPAFSACWLATALDFPRLHRGASTHRPFLPPAAAARRVDARWGPGAKRACGDGDGDFGDSSATRSPAADGSSYGALAAEMRRAAEAEAALAAERQRSGREVQGARDGLQEQLNSVMAASGAEIEEAHTAARKTKAHAERRVAAAEKELARCKEEVREMRQELAATRTKFGSGDPEKLMKDLRRARTDAHKLRESLNVAEQANALLEQQKAALEKRVRNLVKTTRTPRQRLRSAAPLDMEGSPVGRGSGAARSGSANRSGALAVSPPPSELLHPEKTHACE